MSDAIPELMTAISISSPGPPEVLVPVELPVPVPRNGELLIRVVAAGVNRPDIMQRKGIYPPPPGAPETPGLEIAGPVVARGENTGRFKLGENVCALLPGGGYAQYCTVAEANAMPVPKGLTLIEAAATPETFLVVWDNLVVRGRLKSGETTLIHGGSSGIGTTAIMLARALGARVFVTAGSDAKCKACQELGAHLAINYRTEDFVKAVETATAGRGVDVILDIVGGDYVPKNISCSARDGRIVSLATQKGAKVEIDIVSIMSKRLTLTGSTMRPRSVAEKAAVCRAVEEHIWPLVESGKVRPRVYKTFSLTDAAEAHRLMEASTHIGKIMLLPD